MGKSGKVPREETGQVECEVVHVLARKASRAKFKVKLDSGREVNAFFFGRPRSFRRRHRTPSLGDRVKVEISPYDPESGRIVPS
jgi:translation initiation factor IF-1